MLKPAPLLSIPCLVASLATCFAQTLATFKTQSYAERLSFSPLAADVNNDGVLDLLQFQSKPNLSQTATGFTVRIANGNGSFRAPVVYPFSSQLFRPTMISGDFNGDGNLDLIIPSGSDQLTIYLGKSDGTFQAQKSITIALPSGQQFGSSFLAADFNGDSKLDLVATTMTSGSPHSGELYLLPGDGTGNFGPPTLLYMAPANQFVDSDNIAAGDFDGDGRADVAFLDDISCAQNDCFSTLHILYNDGNSQFTDVSVLPSLTNQFLFSAGDLNSDGRTDIFGITGGNSNNPNQLEVLYGQADRTFHTYSPGILVNDVPLTMADFNGDTRMDLVGNQNEATNNQFLLLLAGVGEGTFTQQTAGVAGFQVAGDFNSDTMPDVLAIAERTTTSSTIADNLNSTAGGNWGGCAYPKAGMGIMVCAPDPSPSSPVTFKASANSFGQLRKIELWVDGKKITEQYHTWGPRAWFNFSGTFAPGPHNAVMFAADIDNRLQKTAFAFTVAGGATCSAPTTPGVHICLPASGSTVSSPVQVQAAAKVTGTIAGTQLWIDGVKKFTSSSSTLNTSIAIAAGSHRFAAIAANTAGQKWEQAVDAMVK